MSEAIAIPLGAIRPVSSPFRAGFNSDTGFATRVPAPSTALQDDYARGFADGQAEAEARFGQDTAAANSIRQAIAQLRAEPSEELGLYIAEAVSHLVRQIVGETQITPEEITRRAQAAAAMIAENDAATAMGHELGHYVLGHVWKLVLSFTLVFTFAFWLASRIVPLIVERYGARWKLRGVADVAAFPIYSMVLAVFMLVTTPVTKSIIRMNESAADAFGLDVAKAPDGFASAAMKLSEYRKIEPSPLEEILFYDHPSGKTRVAMSMQWKAKHLAEVEAKAK